MPTAFVSVVVVVVLCLHKWSSCGYRSSHGSQSEPPKRSFQFSDSTESLHRSHSSKGGSFTLPSGAI